MALHPKCSFPDELTSLCEEVESKADNEFSNLIKDCNINLSQNKSGASEYYSLVKSNNKLERKIKRLKIGRGVLVIFLIFPGFLCNNAAKKKAELLKTGSKQEEKVKGQLDGQLSVLQTKVSYEFAFKKIIQPIGKELDLDIYQDIDSFTPGINTVPKMLTKDACWVESLSGRIYENPFILYTYKTQTGYMHTYVGSTTVSYSTTDSKGNRVTRTEVVTASETLPAPQWVDQTELAYLFDRPAELCFYNNASKRQVKKLTKKNEQLPMENKQFDKMFKAIRSNEKDYRVVFTPLAQENYVKLLKEQPFTITKDKEVTFVQMLEAPALNVTNNNTFNYDVKTGQANYNKGIVNLVKCLGSFTMPISAIPLYTQFKTKVPYVKTPNKTASPIQAEENINFLFDAFSKGNSFDTDVIFSAQSSKSMTIGKNKFSVTPVVCHYFGPDHQTIVKMGMSSRGPVAVPIHVIYYRPRTKTYYVAQSTDGKSGTPELIYDSGIAIHRGQLMFLSASAITDKNMNEVKKIIDFYDSINKKAKGKQEEKKA